MHKSKENILQNIKHCWKNWFRETLRIWPSNRVTGWVTNTDWFYLVCCSFNGKQLHTAELCVSSLDLRETVSKVQWWVMTRRTWTAFYRLICIGFEFFIKDCSTFSVICDRTGLNDASLANDTLKNHLSVHYCFFRFSIRSICLIAVVFSVHYWMKARFCSQVCLALNNCIQMLKLFCRG